MARIVSAILFLAVSLLGMIGSGESAAQQAAPDNILSQGDRWLTCRESPPDGPKDYRWAQSDSDLVREGVPVGQISGYRKILRDVAEAFCNGHGEESLAIFNEIFAAQEFPYRIAISADGGILLEDNVLTEGDSWVACRELQSGEPSVYRWRQGETDPVPAGQLEETFAKIDSAIRGLFRLIAVAACNGTAEAQMASLNEGVIGDMGYRFVMPGRGWISVERLPDEPATDPSP